MKWFSRQRRKKGKLLCVLFAAALVTTSLSAGGLTVSVQGAERTFDIGVNPESVTATLAENGLLTVSGSGAIRDFTADTAPFADCQVKSIKLGADVTSIGDYTFYNCGELTGSLVLPKGLLRIGDRAFSGSSAALAPKPSSVENSFTEAKTTKKRETGATESSTASQPNPTPVPSENDIGHDDADRVSSAGAAPDSEQESVSSAPAAQEIETVQENQQEEKQDSKPGSEENDPVPAQENKTEDNSSDGQSSPAAPDADTETKYVIERITQQEIGEEIFYFRTDDPAFFCSAENESFRAAMVAAGYREAGSLLSVTFQCGGGNGSNGDAVTKDLPVLDGKITLPAALPEFSAPEGDGLHTYSFCGWTETKDAANTLRAAGSTFAVGDRTDLYFIANWNPEMAVKISVRQDGGSRVFSVPALEGYKILSYRWQTCVLAAGEKIPLKQDALAWKDISGETAQSYRWKIVLTETGRLFRCVVTVQKQQNFLQALFSADGQEEVAFGAVEAIPTAAADDAVASEGTAIVRGRNFSGSISGTNPTITASGAVTAAFVTQYKPSGTNATTLFLCRKEGETYTKMTIPTGTRMVLGDLTTAGSCKYYSYTAAGGEADCSLAYFSAVGGSSHYSPPVGDGTAITEKLLFVLDFSNAAMPTGEYALAVTHQGGTLANAAKAPFTVTAAEGCGLGLEKAESDEFTWGVTVTPQVSGLNSRYDAGACIRLWATSPDGQKTFRFPEEMVVAGDGENVLVERDGSLTFTMPASGSAAMFLGFSDVSKTVFPDGEYQLHASLAPRAGLQMSGSQGKTDADAAVGVSLYRGEEDEQRSVSVALGGETERLVDVSKGAADMVFLLEYRGIREGDTLQYEVLQKTGKGPDDGSYSPASGSWTLFPAPGLTPTGDGMTLHLTVPKGQERGTYRLLVRIFDASGTSVTEQPYNFIVK